MPSLFSMPAGAARRAIFNSALWTLAALAAGVASAADSPLSLVQAQRLALARSRQLPAQDQAILASREMAVAARQLPDPTLKLGIDNLPVTGPDKLSLTRDFMTMRRVGIMQELTRSDKLNARAERYTRSAEKSLADQQSAIAAIQRDTALAWLERYYAEAMGAVVTAQATLARMEVQVAESAYRSGRGSQADIFGARGALGAMDDRQSEAQRRIRNARTVLARWSGVAPDTPLAGQPDSDTVRLALATLDTTLDHHPQITALRGQENIARADANLALANRKADWSVELAFQQRGAEFSNMISVGLSVPLQWDRKNRQDRELTAKLAMVDQAGFEREEMLRTHIAETRTMLNDWENGRERYARYARELLPLAGQRTQAVLAAYRGGKATLTELLAARRNEIEVGQQALQLQADTARLWAQLYFLFPDEQAMPASMMPLPSHAISDTDAK